MGFLAVAAMIQIGACSFGRGQIGALVECLLWAVVVAAIYATIGTGGDWDRYGPERSSEYWHIISSGWVVVPDFMAWIGGSLVAIVWIHSQFGVRRRTPAGDDGDSRGSDRSPGGLPASLERFVCLYLVAMVVAMLGRVAIVWCWQRGECDLFIWYQALVLSPAYLIWPLVLLLMRRAVWWVFRRRQGCRP